MDIYTNDKSGDAQFILRNNGVYRSTTLLGDISMNSLGRMWIKDDMISNKHIKYTDKIEIEKTTLEHLCSIRSIYFIFVNSHSSTREFLSSTSCFWL